MKHVFISPHIDDALLSLGGLIIKLRNEGLQVGVEYIFTISNWTNPESITGKYYGNTPAVITGIRKAEEESIRRLLDYECHFWDYLDSPLRKLLGAGQQSIMMHELKERFNQLINKDDQYYFPLGLDHPDHVLIREIGLEFLKKGYNILFYEDMPYLTFGHYDKKSLYARVSEEGLVPEWVFIDFDRKRTILCRYESQVSQAWIKDMMNYSYSIRDNSYLERWWKPIARQPNHISSHQ